MGRARTFTGTTSGTVKDEDRIAMPGRTTVCASFERMSSLFFFLPRPRLMSAAQIHALGGVHRWQE
jgi:hypothetical protein